MGWFCTTLPGCPPCDRFRGWNEWNGDLCNEGYSVVKTKDLQSLEDKAHKNITTYQPTELINEALNKTEKKFMAAVDELEGKSLWQDIWLAIEVFMVVVVVLVLLILLVYACNCIRACIPRRKFRGSVNDGKIDNDK